MTSIETGTTRRDAAWLIARAVALPAAAAFFPNWMHASESHSSAPPDPHDWSAYRPKFFSPEEFRTYETFAAILIPSDETPGAREAYVAPFVDFVLNAAAEYAPDTQQEWRNAMAFLGAHGFAQLAPEKQAAFVRSISEPERDSTKTHEGFFVYRLFKDMTVHAFYTSRVGLIDVLEYKGNAYLTQFPACTHPEHQRL